MYLDRNGDDPMASLDIRPGHVLLFAIGALGSMTTVSQDPAAKYLHYCTGGLAFSFWSTLTLDFRLGEDCPHMACHHFQQVY